MKLKLRIFRSETYLGIVEAGDGVLLPSADSAPELSAVIQSASVAGISMKKDITEGDKRILVKEPVSITDPLFALAFRDHLSGLGYYVVEVQSELEEEINKHLATMDDETLKREILATMPMMDRGALEVLLKNLSY